MKLECFSFVYDYETNEIIPVIVIQGECNGIASRLFFRVDKAVIARLALRLVAKKVWVWAWLFLYRDWLRNYLIDPFSDHRMFYLDRYELDILTFLKISLF